LLQKIIHHEYVKQYCNYIIPTWRCIYISFSKLPRRKLVSKSKIIASNFHTSIVKLSMKSNLVIWLYLQAAWWAQTTLLHLVWVLVSVHNGASDNTLNWVFWLCCIWFINTHLLWLNASLTFWDVENHVVLGGDD